MCDCDDSIHIKSLVDALKLGTNEAWETSEPMCVGGPGSATGILYSVRSPFVGDCQWAIDVASAGGTQAQVVISSSPKRFGVDFTGVQPGTGELSSFDGLVINMPPNNTIPIDSEWYSTRDSSNTVYVLVICATNSAFVNMQFRQKRIVK